MFETSLKTQRRTLPLLVSALMCASPVFAQDAPEGAPAKKEGKKPAISQSSPTSPNTTVNLLNLMVKRGLLKQDEAQSLIKQADDEAYVSRQAAKDATAKADEAAKAATAASAAANPPGTRHVTYVPEIVKRQLREDIKKEVMAKAEKENWASPGAYPEWAQRIRFYGDFRGRYQGNFFPTGNDQIDAANFNAINTGSPYDVASLTQNFPTYDTTKNRNQVRLRARLGMDADLSNGFSAGFRIATGQDSSPVSTNQTLGASGGNFSKYALWLDRAYLKWEIPGFTVSAGRFDNPFFSPTDLVWYKDLGFDGFAVQAKHEVAEGVTPFVVGGAFPLFNTDLNLGTNQIVLDNKFSSHDKWLFAGQIGANVKIDPVHSFTVGLAYYDFDNVQGQVSSPCLVLSSSDVCDTDMTRPSFAQKGNTYMPLRAIVVDPAAPPSGLFQYFGLVSQYRPVVASGQFDFGEFHPYHIVLDGEYVVNTAFNRSLMNAMTTWNNRGPSPDGGTTPGAFNGGNQGWMGRVTVGNKEIKHFGDWNVHAGYKYLESDATVDAFVDPDFGLGGTNLKGYFLGANYGISDNVWMTARWMSATNIGGIPYAADVLQVDLNARF